MLQNIVQEIIFPIRAILVLILQLSDNLLLLSSKLLNRLKLELINVKLYQKRNLINLSKNILLLKSIGLSLFRLS